MNKITLLFIPLFYFLFSCGSQKVVATKYYIIEIPMDSVVENFRNTKLANAMSCEIMEVDVNPAYSTNQIANRGNSRSLTYYSLHHWAIRPSTSFSRLMLDYFTHINLFENVSDRFWRTQPDYVLQTTIYHLEVVQEKDTFSAHLNLEFRLNKTDDNQTIIQHRANRYMTLENKDLNLFATAIGEIFYQELENLSEKITLEINESP